MCMCECGCVHHVYMGVLKKPEEGASSPETGVVDCYKLPNVDAGIQVLC